MPRAKPKVERVCFACGAIHMSTPKATRCSDCKKAKRKVLPEIQRALSKKADPDAIREEVLALIENRLTAEEGQQAVLDLIRGVSLAASHKAAVKQAKEATQEAAKAVRKARRAADEAARELQEITGDPYRAQAVEELLAEEQDAEEARIKKRAIERMVELDAWLTRRENWRRKCARKTGTTYQHHIEEYHSEPDARALGLFPLPNTNTNTN